MTNISEASQDDKTMALVAYVVGIFFPILGPLVIWLIKKDQSKFVAFHAMQALIFNAVISVASFISGLLVTVLVGLVLIPVVVIVHIVFSVLAAMAANRGEWYEIPMVGKYARQAAGI